MMPVSNNLQSKTAFTHDSAENTIGEVLSKMAIEL